MVVHHTVAQQGHYWSNVWCTIKVPECDGPSETTSHIRGQWSTRLESHEIVITFERGL